MGKTHPMLLPPAEPNRGYGLTWQRVKKWMENVEKALKKTWGKEEKDAEKVEPLPTLRMSSTFYAFYE